MKTRHYLLTAVFSYLIFLVATIPAKPVTDLLTSNSPVIIQGVSGTLWNGKAYMISTNNMQFKKTSWRFKPWQLLIGKIAIDVDTRFLDSRITTELGTSFSGRYFINDLSAKFHAREVAQLAALPLAQIGGVINININHAQWKQGELPLADGEIKWNNASITVAETASLGNVNIMLSESAQQRLNAEIKNRGGDIKINGTATLVPDKNYTVEIKLRPTATANNNVKQSLGFFSQKQPNGEYLLKKSGSLDQIM